MDTYPEQLYKRRRIYAPVPGGVFHRISHLRQGGWREWDTPFARLPGDFAEDFFAFAYTQARTSEGSSRGSTWLATVEPELLQERGQLVRARRAHAPRQTQRSRRN